MILSKTKELCEDKSKELGSVAISWWKELYCGKAERDSLSHWGEEISFSSTLVLPYQSMVTSYIFALDFDDGYHSKSSPVLQPSERLGLCRLGCNNRKLIQCLIALSANSSTWTVSFLHVLVQQLRT